MGSWPTFLIQPGMAHTIALDGVCQRYGIRPSDLIGISLLVHQVEVDSFFALEGIKNDNRIQEELDRKAEEQRGKG